METKTRDLQVTCPTRPAVLAKKYKPIPGVDHSVTLTILQTAGEEVERLQDNIFDEYGFDDRFTIWPVDIEEFLEKLYDLLSQMHTALAEVIKEARKHGFDNVDIAALVAPELSGYEATGVECDGLDRFRHVLQKVWGGVFLHKAEIVCDMYWVIGAPLEQQPALQNTSYWGR